MEIYGVDLYQQIPLLTAINPICGVQSHEHKETIAIVKMVI